MPTSSSPIPSELLETLGLLAQVLDARQTRYALIGGLGVAVHGAIRATRDVDMVLSVPQIELPRLLESLGDHGCQLDLYKSVAAWRDENMLGFSFGPVRVDWIKAVIPAFERILDRARWEDLGGVRVCVADPEGLILLKLIAFRARDQEDIRSILAANPGGLDLDWVRQQWCELTTPGDPRTGEFERLVGEFYRQSPPTKPGDH
jgi:predicted nucleotidyltransferase